MSARVGSLDVWPRLAETEPRVVSLAVGEVS
jgi:hypothetical protein